MTLTLIDDPEALRLRGAEMRQRAEKAVLPEIRQGLFRIAADYDMLATRAERRLVMLAKKAEIRDQSTRTEPTADQAAIAPNQNHTSSEADSSKS
jgi:hypothetical protein